VKPLLFFDLDDTLVDHRAAEEAAHRETHAEHPGVFGGVPFSIWLAQYRKNNFALWALYGKGEIDRHELSRRRFSEPLLELDLDPAQGKAIGTTYLSFYARHWQLVEGAEEILEFASRYGAVGILSNGLREQQWNKIRDFRLDRWVTHVVLSEEVGAMKPDRAIFDAASRAAGGGDVRKVYVGDSWETDVLGAKAAGWFPIWFDREAQGAPAPVVYVTRLVDLKPLLV
jgi:putative hydrolase of the HAD superfamily